MSESNEANLGFSHIYSNFSNTKCRESDRLIHIFNERLYYMNKVLSTATDLPVYCEDKITCSNNEMKSAQDTMAAVPNFLLHCALEKMFTLRVSQKNRQ